MHVYVCKYVLTCVADLLAHISVGVDIRAMCSSIAIYLSTDLSK